MTLSRHLSYANVASTLALVLALGGGGAAVAAGLGKNTVGTKQLKPAAVRLTDLGPNSVDAARIVDNSVSGSEVAESSLGKVPSASTADTAVTATNALFAGRSTNVLRATVTGAGAIVPAQSDAGVTATALGGGTFEVVFGRNVAACTQVVGIAQPGYAGSASAIGSASPNGVYVYTFAADGTPVDLNFALLLVC
jgi:hypothetical protein